MRSLALLLFGACACCGAAAETPDVPAEGPLSPESVPDAATLEQSGVVIGQILVYPENIFDLNDPKEDKSLYRLANQLHIKTREHVVRQQLLLPLLAAPAGRIGAHPALHPLSLRRIDTADRL